MTVVTPGARGTGVLAGVLLLVLSVLDVPVLSSAPVWAAESYPVPGSGTFRLAGGGFGHGIGMSQFGAEGMGRLGKSYRQILAFYYPGTNLATGSTSRTIKVSLSGVNRVDGYGTFVVVKARDGLQLSNDGRTRSLPTRVSGGRVSSYRVIRGSSLSVVAYGSSGSERVAKGLKGNVRFATARGQRNSRVSVVSSSGSTRTYRGFLDVRRTDSGLLTMSNVLLEDYLRSVVSSEIPSNWTAAALRAQAVAARSYALLAQLNARADGRAYDICDTSSCQAYGEISTESGPQSRAVADTAGVFVKSGGQPAFTMFSSANGGYTVSGSRSYLVAKPDPYDGVVSGDANWGHRWTDAVSAGTIERAWPQVGAVRSLRVLSRDGNGQWGGRVQSVAIVGSKDTISVSGDSFRWATGLKSTWWSVTNVTAKTKVAPDNVRTTARDQGFRLRWGEPNTDKSVRGYRVEVQPGDQTIRLPAGDRSLRVRGLTNGREYRARVRAIYRGGPGPAASSVAVVPISAFSYYRPVGVTRVVDADTTSAVRASGGRNVRVVGSGRLPESGTRAAVLRVSVHGDGRAGRALVWPKGVKERRVVAAIYRADGASSGVVTVPVNDSGAITVGTTTRSRGLTVDLLGYYSASAVASNAFHASDVQRVVSSATGKAWDGGRLRQGEPRTVRIAGRGAVPEKARTVLVNVSLSRPSDPAALSLAPVGTAPSLGTVVRANARELRSATTIARLDRDGRLSLRLSEGRSDVAIDVLGWFHDPHGARNGRYRSLTPRPALTPKEGGTLAKGQSRLVKVRGDGTGVPGSASAVTLLVIARGQSTGGSVSITPAGSDVIARPMVSFGRTGAVRNTITVPIGTDGRVRVHAPDAGTEVTVQVVGWYS